MFKYILRLWAMLGSSCSEVELQEYLADSLLSILCGSSWFAKGLDRFPEVLVNVFVALKLHRCHGLEAELNSILSPVVPCGSLQGQG
jgi:hypothetical protein